jgi:hypothetical protein
LHLPHAAATYTEAAKSEKQKTCHSSTESNANNYPFVMMLTWVWRRRRRRRSTTSTCTASQIKRHPTQAWVTFE